MNLTLYLNYLTRQLKFVFLFVIWSYCLLRISHNTISTAWVSLSEGIHQKGVGEQTKLFMNADEFLYFDNNNQLVGNV